MGDKPEVLGEVKKFNKGSLKKTEPQVKISMPTQSDIDQEKQMEKEAKEAKK